MGRFPASLLLVGAGKMGGAMLRAWLDRGLAPEAAAILDPHVGEEMAAFAAAKGLRLNAELPAAPEVLVLAVKPQTFDEAGASLSPLAGPQTLVLSILAGKTIANISARMTQAKAVVRAMPNLPASVGRGATALAADARLSAGDREIVETLIGATGLVEWLADESLIDAATAISGSGPAYVFLLAECLAEAGARLGLPADVATRLARATVEGAGELLTRSERSAAELRESVTSRGGTTAAALEILMGEGGLAPLILRAAEAARRRSHELSG